ncbi:MAG: hypothetical protein R3B06_12545 [Kofleriaceae bacterium]
MTHDRWRLPAEPCLRGVDSFAALAAVRFRAGVNAACWPRSLAGDFGQVVAALEARLATDGDGVALAAGRVAEHVAGEGLLDLAEGDAGVLEGGAARLRGHDVVLLGLAVFPRTAVFSRTAATRSPLFPNRFDPIPPATRSPLSPGDPIPL